MEFDINTTLHCVSKTVLESDTERFMAAEQIQYLRNRNHKHNILKYFTTLFRLSVLLSGTTDHTCSCCTLSDSHNRLWQYIFWAICGKHNLPQKNWFEHKLNSVITKKLCRVEEYISPDRQRTTIQYLFEIFHRNILSEYLIK